MKTKYVTKIEMGDGFTNVKIDEDTILDEVFVVFVKNDNVARLKPRRRRALPVAVLSYTGPGNNEIYEVYATSRNACLAYEPKGEYIDCGTKLTHVFIMRSP
jgi:hypothetical protein